MQNENEDELKNLHDCAAAYLKEVIPSNAPVVQYSECLRAFMAGAYAANYLVKHGVNIDEELRVFLRTTSPEGGMKN